MTAPPLSSLTSSPSWRCLDPLRRFSPLPRLYTVGLEGATRPQVKVMTNDSRSRALDGLLITRLPDVIAQMFEWDWNSVADECTSFLGPAGYGFVQGESNGLRIFPPLNCLMSPSEPRAGAHRGPSVVDRLPARLLHTHLQARYPVSIPEHDHGLSRGWCQGHRGLVEPRRLRQTRNMSLTFWLDTIWNHMTAGNPGVGVAGSSS